jgi:hypothetical protein
MAVSRKIVRNRLTMNSASSSVSVGRKVSPKNVKWRVMTSRKMAGFPADSEVGKQDEHDDQADADQPAGMPVASLRQTREQPAPGAVALQRGENKFLGFEHGRHGTLPSARAGGGPTATSRAREE